MRRFFFALFVLSVIATAGAYYWRTYLPEAIATVSDRSRSIAPGAESESAVPEARSFQLEKVPSDRQDFAVTISIWSSIISALAAIVQTWLTARSIRR